MDEKGLVELVEKYQDVKDYIHNEEAAKMALIVPFIRLLGYDPNNPREVRLEYRAPFMQGDGKRLPDRMDYVIFDATGEKPLFVIEAKDLGTNLRTNSQQLARYIAQMSELHFGIMTDGCSYMLFGDLEQPNIMDREPFFSFSLADEREDWSKVAAFLQKFSRESFNAKTLIIDAENSRFRRAMITRLATALKEPGSDETFLKWLTADVYTGKRTAAVMERLGVVAKDAIEPALLRVLGRSIAASIERKFEAEEVKGEKEEEPPGEIAEGSDPEESGEKAQEDVGRKKIVTTEEELEFYDIARQICIGAGYNGEEIIYRDTLNYFNVSFRRPTKWFLRYFGASKRKAIVTWVSVDEARELAEGLETEAAPGVFGVSRVYLDTVGQLWALKQVVLRSLEQLTTEKPKSQSVEDQE
ncbi:MAG: type I restriction endonuclease [Pseudomonadota bacterium]|nr:type I restriction endonuclease [Pseudomonadota bacterium]